MKKFFKASALLLVLILALSAFAACGDKSSSGGTMGLEDGEDVAVEELNVNVANLTGKDAVALYVRYRYSDSETGDWSPNMLKEESFHSDNAVPFTFNKPEDGTLYDIRLEYGDGSLEDFLSIDLVASKSMVKLEKGVPGSANQ